MLLSNIASLPYINYCLPLIKSSFAKIFKHNIANNKKGINHKWEQKQLPRDYAVLARRPSIGEMKLGNSKFDLASLSFRNVLISHPEFTRHV